MKLNEKGSKTLKEVLNQSDGPFSKSPNVMLALELMERGQELASNQVTKVHLANIIKAICNHSEWTEELVEEENVETNTGPPLERVPRVHRHPSILSNGCQAPVLKWAGPHSEAKAGANI